MKDKFEAVANMANSSAISMIVKGNLLVADRHTP